MNWSRNDAVKAQELRWVGKVGSKDVFQDSRGRRVEVVGTDLTMRQAKILAYRDLNGK